MSEASKETAVTENTTYDTQKCRICSTEVATDPAAPASTFEPHGYAVILSSRNPRQEVEHEGNWDRKLTFESDTEATHLPPVEGYIICEDCAQSIHDSSSVAQNYTGRIPNDLRPASNNMLANKTTIVAIFLMLLLLIGLLYVL